MPTKKQDVLGPILFGRQDKISTELPLKIQQCINHIEKHPWNMMTAVDPLTDRPLIWTRHEKNKEIGTDPFPNKPYLKYLVNDIVEEAVLLVPKSRQMIVTTTALIVCLWEIMFRQSQRIILSKVTEDEAIELLENKVRFTYRAMPGWLREYRKVEPLPRDNCRVKKNNSYIIAAAQNAADRECRGGTATRLIVDEACYQDKLQDIISAGQPMTDHVMMMSTPNAGYPGGRFMKAVIYDEEIGFG